MALNMMPAFDINDPHSLQERWNDWITRYNRILDDLEVAEENKKINKFFIAAGSDVEKKYRMLINGNYAKTYQEIT
jgi:hypothetical protein